jgi:alpha-galactosidase
MVMAMEPVRPSSLLQLTAGGVTVLVAAGSSRLPRVVYWGRALPTLGEEAAQELLGSRDAVDMIGSGQLDATIPILGEASDEWFDEPGVVGSREGSDFSTGFVLTSLENDADHLMFEGEDATAGLAVRVELGLEASGLLSARARLINRGDTPFDLEALTITLPLPADESEVFDQTGRWLRERTNQRHHLTAGIHGQETRVSRGLRASAVHGVCEPATDWRHGRAHLVHVAWSGNTRTEVVLNSIGQQYVRAGELLYPGEIRLRPGEEYSTPVVLGSCGDGLDQASHRFHEHVRALASHPGSARPVTLNSWEAVYFDQTPERLTELASCAASVGVERFVLDDGWFSSRRGDSSGLGDWTVSDDVWPDGLQPLIDVVHGCGMQFGIWVEPEMVNLDSELARRHPEWILAAGGRLPRPMRHQQALDLTIPEAWDDIHAQLEALLDAYEIDYIKWDFNRDLVEAGSQASGTAAYHRQVEAVYGLISALASAHPGLEIESCASGGGRLDLGILEHVQRVWTSDCLDPVERERIHDGTDLLLPPEVMGAHIGSAVAHSTGRESTLQFRAVVAMFYHLGIESDLTRLGDDDRRQLREWVGLHKSRRDLFHHGVTVHGRGPGVHLRGIVNEDRDHAVYALTSLQTPPAEGFGRIRLPGLDADRTYRITPLAPARAPQGRVARTWPQWWSSGQVSLPGAVLDHFGLPVPRLNPQQGVLIECRAE